MGNGVICCFHAPGLYAGFFQLNFVISTNAPQVIVGGIRHEDVDVSRLANSGKINDAHLATVHWNNHFLRTFNDCGLELCFVIIRYGNRFICDSAHAADMRQRMEKFALSLHPEKTRLIEFGRYAAERRSRRGLGKPEA
jgi:hypothetical protein